MRLMIALLLALTVTSHLEAQDRRVVGDFGLVSNGAFTSGLEADRAALVLVCSEVGLRVGLRLARPYEGNLNEPALGNYWFDDDIEHIEFIVLAPLARDEFVMQRETADAFAASARLPSRVTITVHDKESHELKFSLRGARAVLEQLSCYSA